MKDSFSMSLATISYRVNNLGLFSIALTSIQVLPKPIISKLMNYLITSYFFDMPVYDLLIYSIILWYKRFRFINKTFFSYFFYCY